MIPGASQFGNAVSKVGSYFGNIAKNVRDVPTAAGTNIQIARAGGPQSMQGSKLDVAGSKNFSTQMKEVGGAFLGRPGTRSDQFTQGGGYKSGVNLNK
jgi:hypothetical protein